MAVAPEMTSSRRRKTRFDQEVWQDLLKNDVWYFNELPAHARITDEISTQHASLAGEGSDDHLHAVFAVSTGNTCGVAQGKWPPHSGLRAFSESSRMQSDQTEGARQGPVMRPWLVNGPRLVRNKTFGVRFDSVAAKEMKRAVPQ